MGTKRRTGRPQAGSGPWVQWIKLGLVVAVAALYSYALFLRPLLGGEAAFGPGFASFGSPWSRLAGALTVPSGGVGDDCGVPLGVMWSAAGPSAFPASSPLPYGAVAEDDLPWSAAPPARLTRLREEVGAHRLVSAFRVTFANPVWDEAANVARGAEYLAGTVVGPGESRSLFAAIGPFTEERGYGDGPSYANNRIVPSTGGGVCKIATGLYNALVHSDLTVLERRPHSMLVPYVPPGRDAAIATGAKDVRFRNDQDGAVLLWSALEDTTLYVAVYGRHEPPVIEWFHEETDRRRAEPVRRPNPDLPSGVEQLVVEGYDGLTVRTWIVVRRPGQADERRDMGVDTYRPLPGVVEYGP